jgi:hypothetical protein
MSSKLERIEMLLYVGIAVAGFVGVLTGFFLHHWLVSLQDFDGTMFIFRDDTGKIIHSLELNGNPDELAYKPLIIFRVKTNLERGDNGAV